MKISDLIKMGLRNLGRRKARTSLTVIGIVIGTISIVVMISIGVGMKQNFREQLMQYGSFTLVTIEKEQSSFDEKGEYKGDIKQKLDDRLVRNLAMLPHVKAVAPSVNINFKFKSGNYETNMRVEIMDSSAFESFGFPALKDNGNYQKSTSKVKLKIWAGADIFTNFYNPNSSNYQSKIIDPKKTRITASIQDYDSMPTDDNGMPKIQVKEYNTEFDVFEAKEYSQYSWSAYMDRGQFLSVFKEYLKQLPVDKRKIAEKKIKNYESIKINVDSAENVREVQDAIKELGYKSSSMSDQTEQLEKYSRTIQLVLGGVGAISMLVAAISIANTMIMSIYERTKEIGIMKVLGCQIADIKKLFLFEAAMLGLIGGIIGIVMSYGASHLLNTVGGALGESLMGMMGPSGEGSGNISIIPFWLPFAAAGFAMFIGIISGYYPASRATKISAIEAMKNE